MSFAAIYFDILSYHIRGHPGAFREGEVLRQFQGEVLVQIFYFSIHSIYFHLPQLKIGRSQPA